jgi:hypothetical protein
MFTVYTAEGSAHYTTDGPTHACPFPVQYRHDWYRDDGASGTTTDTMWADTVSSGASIMAAWNERSAREVARNAAAVRHTYSVVPGCAVQTLVTL